MAVLPEDHRYPSVAQATPQDPLILPLPVLPLDLRLRYPKIHPQRVHLLLVRMHCIPTSVRLHARANPWNSQAYLPVGGHCFDYRYFMGYSVGYGDVTPRSDLQIVFFIFAIPVLCASFVVYINSLVDAFTTTFLQEEEEEPVAGKWFYWLLVINIDKN